MWLILRLKGLDKCLSGAERSEGGVNAWIVVPVDVGTLPNHRKSVFSSFVLYSDFIVIVARTTT